MSVVLLVRHGQASFGTDDYDRLSARGEAQSRTLGVELRERRIEPARIVTGCMRRQRETALQLIAGAAWDAQPDVDTGWDEFDASSLIAASADEEENSGTDPRAFQRLLERASTRWASGEHDADYAETFSAFQARVAAALDRVVDGLGSGQTAVVVSSAGAIAWVASQLIGGDFSQWLVLNRVAVNSGVTKLVVGASGTSLVGFNDHCHLAHPDVTYR
ncbi:histidine phosphatase family protein [Saccharopolyspora shandongensis]|uniref:histidine phosphatase family protein n=1 Tax=Saccharopolyspora shandongensis TaxID=418495 RepID=UPI0033D0D5D1